LRVTLAQVLYLVICGTNIREALIPQLNVTWDLRGYGSEELRRRRRIDIDRPSREVVAKHLSRAGERKRLNRNIGLVQQLERLGVGGVGEESGAERVEDSSDRVSAASVALVTCCCGTLTLRRTKPGTSHRFLPGCRTSLP
jgi:hypothetical protein